MKLFFLRVFNNIKQGENIDLIIIAILGIIISILNTLGYAPPNLVSSITLATLGLLAVGLLVSRYKLDDIYKSERTKDTVQFSDCEISTLNNLLEKSDEIWMVGLLLRNTTSNSYYSFKNRVCDRLKIRVIVVDLKKIQIEQMVKRFSRAGKKENFLSDMEQVINQYTDICQSAQHSEQVQLKMLDFIPSFSMYIFPQKNNNGIAIIENYCYKSAKGSIPKFQINENVNSEWYKHFVDQFELMWKDSINVDLCNQKKL